MSHLNLVKPGSTQRSTFKPVLVPRPEEQEQTYQAAYELVTLIEEHLSAGTQHYRTKSGTLLRTLDEVVNAILADDLQIGAAETVWQEQVARAA